MNLYSSGLRLTPLRDREFTGDKVVGVLGPALLNVCGPRAVVEEYDSCPQGQKGELLRREGLFSSQIT